MIHFPGKHTDIGFMLSLSLYCSGIVTIHLYLHLYLGCAKMVLAKSVSPAENDTHFSWMSMWNKWWNKNVEQKSMNPRKGGRCFPDDIAFRFFIQAISQLPKQSHYAIFFFPPHLYVPL